MQRVWGTAPMRLADAGGGGGRFPAAQVRGVHSLPRSAAPSAPPCGPALAPVQCPPRWAHGLRPSHRSLWKLFFCAGQAPDQRPAAARAFPPHPRKRCCTRRAQSSACSTQAETGVPEWGGQGHGVRGKRKRRLRAPGRGRARRDLESGLGSEFREAQPDTCMFEGRETAAQAGGAVGKFLGRPCPRGTSCPGPADHTPWPRRVKGKRGPPSRWRRRSSLGPARCGEIGRTAAHAGPSPAAPPSPPPTPGTCPRTCPVRSPLAGRGPAFSDSPLLSHYAPGVLLFFGGRADCWWEGVG